MDNKKDTLTIKKAYGFLASSKVYNSNKNSFSTAIPKAISNKFNLNSKDVLLWDIEGDKIIICVKEEDKKA